MCITFLISCIVCSIFAGIQSNPLNKQLVFLQNVNERSSTKLVHTPSGRPIHLPIFPSIYSTPRFLETAHAFASRTRPQRRMRTARKAGGRAGATESGTYGSLHRFMAPSRSSLPPWLILSHSYIPTRTQDEKKKAWLAYMSEKNSSPSTTSRRREKGKKKKRKKQRY